MTRPFEKGSGWRKLIAGAIALSATLMAVPARADDTAAAGDPPPTWQKFLDNEYYKVGLDVRTRMELANFESFSDSSQAYTTRIRAGIGSKPFYGLSGLAELESSFSYDNGAYWDVVSSNSRGQTPIADPRNTDLNQLYLRYENADLLGLSVTGGRQRIILDDHRFIGNVGWRQNEQTYDSAFGSTSLGLDGLTAAYGYIRDVKRIFGNDGSSATRDWDSDSHIVNVSYEAFAPLQVVGFAYLLDFRDDSPGNSSNSYGFRVNGEVPLAEDWKTSYAGSYAHQTDAGRNPVDYDADYVAAEATLGYTPIASFTTGYELLGSDDGTARFVTPLATLHKFNGFADVFLDNGGPNGLQDLYAAIAPKLPWELKGKFIYHHFWSDEGGTALGEEYDFVMSRAITSYLSVLTKGALFESKNAALADGWRFWLEFTVSY